MGDKRIIIRINTGDKAADQDWTVKHPEQITFNDTLVGKESGSI